jgi:1-acyl-sn-glycerol-3-phosphate acyltransferase
VNGRAPARVGTLRAACRLAGCLLRVAQGLLVCALLFPFLDTPGRRVQVGRFSRKVLRALGLRLDIEGEPRPGPVMLVANHVSWLDILAINAARPARFVSKADVRHWPVLGWMVECGGTLFIERERKRDAMRVVHQVAQALQAGDAVAVFPEGTTGDGRGLLPFHANLLQAAIAAGAPVQGVALRYADAGDAISKAAPYVGDITLLGSLWSVVSARGLCARVVLLPAEPAGEPDRRLLSQRVRGQIEQALDGAGPR